MTSENKCIICTKIGDPVTSPISIDFPKKADEPVKYDLWKTALSPIMVEESALVGAKICGGHFIREDCNERGLGLKEDAVPKIEKNLDCAESSMSNIDASNNIPSMASSLDTYITANSTTPPPSPPLQAEHLFSRFAKFIGWWHHGKTD